MRLIKAQTYLARDFANRWSKPPPPDAERDALAHAWEQGFIRAREMAAGLCVQLGVGGQLDILIGGIGQVRVDPETGTREEQL